MASDPDLLEAYRRQLRSGLMPPGAVLMMWKGQEGVDLDDLIDEFHKVDREPD